MRRTAVFAGLLALSSTAQGAREPIELEPNSPWVVDYAEERCSLLRDFGKGDSSIRLQIDSYGNWNAFRMVLSGKAVPRYRVPSGSVVRYRFPPDKEERGKASALLGAVDRSPAASFGVYFAPYFDPAVLNGLDVDEIATLLADARFQPSEDFERAIDMIMVEFDRGDPFGRKRGVHPALSLRTGPMDKPLAALRACIDDLYRSWGFDPVAQKALSRPPMPLPETVQRVASRCPALRRACREPVHTFPCACGSILRGKRVPALFKCQGSTRRSRTPCATILLVSSSPGSMLRAHRPVAFSQLR
jgi:hypothetical protein